MTVAAGAQAPKPQAPPAPMSRFERFLTVWVALCIVAGIGLGHLFPAAFRAIGSAEVAKVNLPVAVLIWLMVIPMLLKIDFASLRHVGRHWRGIGVTLFVNWAVKPFSMAALGWLFIGYLFRPYLPAEQIDSYIAGLIILAAAPCTAMVFVWSNLTRGEPHFTLSQVTLDYAGRTLVLPQAMSASGARYADGHGNEFWGKGLKDATFTLAGEPARTCHGSGEELPAGAPPS